MLARSLNSVRLVEMLNKLRPASCSAASLSGVSKHVSLKALGNNPSPIKTAIRSLTSVRKPNQRPIGIIGAPMSAGQKRPGTELGPKALRDANLIKYLKRVGYDDIRDYGDIEIEKDQRDVDIKLGNLVNPFTVSRGAESLNRHVVECLGENRIALTLGGDHSIGIATVQAQAQVHGEDGFVLIWIDAHADINTCETTQSGSLHGMPLSFSIKELYNDSTSCNVNKDFPQSSIVRPCLSASRIAYIGLRDVDRGEEDLLNQLGIANFSMDALDRMGPHRVIEEALAVIDPDGRLPIHVSFDIDAVDPIWAPCTGTPVPGGLTLREALSMGEVVAQTGRLAGLDMVEVNPMLPGDAKMTVNSAINIILAFMGKQRLQLHARPPGTEHYTI